MYRDTPKMFAGDAKCLEIVQKAITDGMDKKLPFYQRLWLYTALTRQENLKVLEASISHFEQLGKESSAGKNKDFYEFGVKFTKSQHDLIKRFGRFPNRNVLLSRQNTEEENKYLNSDNKAFST